MPRGRSYRRGRRSSSRGRSFRRGRAGRRSSRGHSMTGRRVGIRL